MNVHLMAALIIFFGLLCFVYGYVLARMELTRAWEVLHQGPSGDMVVGLYFNEDDAKERAEKWNAEHSHPWDKALIVPRKIE